jgi:alkanesulfonate monooxygenase SsuD/methylene tetrahydromethanopterin reductase-like flavin-dependent oxidoreductase (luciferase family)
MTSIGYTLMTEQSGPKELVTWAIGAERAGFDFEVMSDHYFPWLDEQGHAPYAWTVLGAVAQVTARVELMTYVTCPMFRYHPAVVAQKAATMQILSDGRFTLGLGSGENLNEHVIGDGWPPVNVRHEMLDEAIEIIRWPLRRRLRQLRRAVLPRGLREALGPARGPRAHRHRGFRTSEHRALRRRLGAHGLPPSRRPMWSGPGDAARGGQSRKIGQVPISWDRDREAAVTRAHEQFRWFAGGWKVNAELPGTSAFSGATQFVRAEDVAAAIPCGPDVDPIVESFAAFWDAGYTDVSLVQIGGDAQAEFLEFAETDLLPALRAAAPAV